jgi:hypothetical protein
MSRLPDLSGAELDQSAAQSRLRGFATKGQPRFGGEEKRRRSMAHGRSDAS